MAWDDTKTDAVDVLHAADYNEIVSQVKSKIAAAGVTFENLNTNGDVGTGSEQVSQGNHTHPYQPADATLTAFAGITTAANKLPYATGEDTFGVCDFTPLGQSLIGTTTTSAVRDLIAAASSTTATQSIYVDSAATGTGTGVDWANAFTTIQAAVDSLPAVINHAVTIIIRKGSTPYDENIKIQRVIAAGSIEIRGEYYWYGTVAASKTGKITLGVSDFGYANRAQIAVGDIVWATKWSGAVGASTPSESIIDTVASVSGAEVTLTTNTGKSLDSTWTYQIVNTAINGAITINNTDTMLVLGLKGSALNLSNSQGWRSSVCYFEHSSNVVYATSSSNLISGQFAMQRCCIVYSSAGGIGVPVALIGCNTFNAQNIFASAGGLGSSRGIFQQMGGYTQINNCHVMGLSGGSQSGIYVNNNGYVYLSNCLIDGFDASNKLTNGLYAQNGGVLQVVAGVTIGSNVTTQKNPANWAATTDGSYIS